MSGIVNRDSDRKRAPMPHFKCVTCRTRLSSAGTPVDVCDGCGSPLELVAELAEVVGYRAIAPGPYDGSSRRRRSMQAQARRSAELWIDEEAVAMALPRPEADR